MAAHAFLAQFTLNMYTLTLCLGMWAGICGQIRDYHFQTLQDCQAAQATIPQSSIGKGYALCIPSKQVKL